MYRKEVLPPFTGLELLEKRLAELKSALRIVKERQNPQLKRKLYISKSHGTYQFRLVHENEGESLQTAALANQNTYSVKITNNGDGFVDLTDSSLEQGYSHHYFSDGYSSNCLELIAPGESQIVYFHAKDTSNLTLVASGYSNLKTDIFTVAPEGPFSKTWSGWEQDGQEIIRYSYSTYLNATKNVDDNHFYSLIFSVNYNGKNHYYYQYNVGYIGFSCYENIDVNNITLGDIYFIDAGKESSSFNPSFSTFMIFIIGIYILIPTLIFGGIITAIVFLIRGIVKNVKNKKNKVNSEIKNCDLDTADKSSNVAQNPDKKASKITKKDK